jgi:hypothetical protein
MKRWKKIFQANGARKQTGVAIITSDKEALVVKPQVLGSSSHNF